MLHLNAFSLSVPDTDLHVLASARDADRDRKLREERDGYIVYGWGDSTYLWPEPNGQLPELEAPDWHPVPVAALPARVIAFAARDAVLAKLRDKGFEKLPGRLANPLRLYRRKRKSRP